MKSPPEPVKSGSVDIEEFAKNVARMVEEGGRALAAYLKPREEGRVDEQQAEVSDVVKTFGKVAGYWFADPQRTLELQSSLGKAYLDLWANAVKRMAGEEVTPVAKPEPRDKRFADPEWSQQPVLRFPQAGLPAEVHWANHLVTDAKGLDPHTQHKAEFYLRQIANARVAVELRADQPRIAARDAEHQRRQPGARHAHAGRRHSGRARRPENSPVGRQDVRGRPQSRANARQSDLPERADAAHPIHADDRNGAQTAAADRARPGSTSSTSSISRRKNPSSSGASTTD